MEKKLNLIEERRMVHNGSEWWGFVLSMVVEIAKDELHND